MNKFCSKVFYALTITVFLSLFSCFGSKSIYSVEAQEKFEGKWDKFVEPGEKVVTSWYHFLSARNYQGKLVYREFYPETKVQTIEETFSDEDMQIKDGAATYWYENGVTKEIGAYRYNKRVGEWKYYRWPDGTLSKEGRFSAGIPSGKWTYYDDNSNPVATLNLSNEKEADFIIFNGDTNDFKLKSTFGSEAQMSEITTPYLQSCDQKRDAASRNSCTEKALKKYFLTNFKYPDEAKGNRLEGRVVLRFVFSKEGSVEEILVVRGLNKEIEQEVVRLMEKMPAWNVEGFEKQSFENQYLFAINIEI